MVQATRLIRQFVTFSLLLLSALAVIPAGGSSAGAQRPNRAARLIGWDSVPAILARIKPPRFPAHDFNITSYGAIPDARTDATGAIRKAIEACNAAGGGRVVVPAGVFLTGAIHLKSNVNLYVSEGATLKFSTDPAQYLPVVYTRFEGTECMNYSPFIYAFEQQNIAVTGKGTLDGSASDENWWAWTRRKGNAEALARSSVRKLLDYGERGVPVKDRIFGQGEFLRPNFIQPYRSRNILIEGIHIINSPMWEIHPVLSTNVTVRGVTIATHGPNNDGCNPESSRDVLIEDSVFDTGDDCIAIKSGRNADGRRINVPTKNIIVRGCRMRDGHGGITVGSEISGGVSFLFAENCDLDSPNLDHALRVKNNAMRGGVLENFFFRNIRVGQVAHAVITIDFNYEEGAKGNFKPVMRNYTVERLVSTKSQHVADVQGLENAPIVGLNLINCTFEGAAQPSIIRNVKDLRLNNVKVNGNVITQLQ